MLKRAVINITTNGSGAGSGSFATPVSGLLYGIEYVKGNFDDGIDFTLSAADSAITDLLYTGTNVNASAVLLPRLDLVNNTGTAQSMYTGLIPFFGTLTVAVTSGGDTKTGTFVVWWMD